MATSGGETAYKTFRKHSADLLKAIQDPEVLAWELFSESVVTFAVVEFANNMIHERGARTSKLLMAVESQIKVDPEAFDVFLSALAGRSQMSDICERMKDTYSDVSSCLSQPPAKRPRPQHPQTEQSVDLQHRAVIQYASYLKSVYTRKKLPTYDKWPLVKCKKYINLALIEKENITKQETDQFTRDTIHGNIDDINNSKRAIDIGQIAQLPDGSQPECILVEGAPGVGKSTFAFKLCRKWGKGKLLQQYQLVILLRLRDKSVRAAKNISDLFRYHDHQIQRAVVEEIKRTGGQLVLLLLDGYDELPKNLRRSSVFDDVIMREELPEATVLITSRPWASEYLHLWIHVSQHIEILGFTTKNIQLYLESTISNDPSLLADLKMYISCYPHINSLMYIPLNSAIVVEVYKNSRKDKTLVPKTMTELYSSLVRSLLLCHLLDHPVHGKKRRWRVCSFSDLPQDVYQQLCELGRIAYEGILNDQQVIFSDLPDEFETLGLMQCAPELYVDEGVAVSYNFLHLTVQEYMAAFHLSQQPVKKQIEHFMLFKELLEFKKVIMMPARKSCSNLPEGQSQSKYFSMVLRFLFGIKRFNGFSSMELNTLWKMKHHHDSASVENSFTFDTLHWLFEAQDNDVIAKLQGSSLLTLQLYDMIQSTYYRTVTAFDSFVLGYCVSHSNCTWKLNFWDCFIGDKGVEMFMRGATERETHCTGGISEIDLCENDITSETVKHLLNVPKQIINKLETLDLHSNKLDSEFCATLAQLIPHVPHLKKLNLSSNPNIGQGGAVPLITSLTAHTPLEELSLGKTGIGVEDCQALSELLSSSTSLLMLNINCNDLPPEAVELIAQGLHHNTTLKWLYMSHSHFSLQNSISLTSALRTNHVLIHLALPICEIDSDGACQ